MAQVMLNLALYSSPRLVPPALSPLQLHSAILVSRCKVWVGRQVGGTLSKREYSLTRVRNVNQVLQREYPELDWVRPDRCLMFDDDSGALGGHDKGRLVKVPAYEYWEPCQWDEVIDEEFLYENSDENVTILTDSVVQWKLAPPSFGKVNLTEQDEKETEKWAEKKKKREKMHMAYNKLAVKDKLWVSVKEYMQTIARYDEETMDALPSRIKSKI